ncbi:TetR/AcrR family transcriptional regulator [Desulfoplanes formicivorans]|uniref:TetR family transcriptional regulator n=1 Tax=Desulfoplanes formicivorans TaxID=1592317 RepID=A0A194AGR0_9BACT|nr:TetR/AcrR family transcriptional regulator [Desulfoplanes formicivorans]GAU08513.1 TetR family transcriptional regulator [Desulfoplanes formicivorans]
MARAQFDREEVLDKVIELFWEKGYSGSSMQQVVNVTGLKPGSIYLSFTNKEGLFREALERYARKRKEQLRAVLDGAPSVGEGICAVFEQIVGETTAADYTSCFLVKTQLELAHEKSELQSLADAKLNEVEALFRTYLEKEYSREVSRDRATSIMLHIFGVRVYGYRQDSAEQIRRGLRQGLPWLPWPGKE